MKINFKAVFSKNIILTILLALALLFLFVSVPINAETDHKKDSSETLQSLRQWGADLYSQFLEFKNEQDFIQNGFGYSKSRKKYEKWKSEVELLEKACLAELNKLPATEKLESKVFSIYNSTTELKSIARLYAMSGGEETKRMKKKKRVIEEQFILEGIR